MKILQELYIIILTILFVSENGAHAKIKTEETIRKFPDNLLFGAATSSYQVEGAWDEDGKTESIWDQFTHSKPCGTTDCRNGDVACDSYHNVERDVEMMRELGLDFYRFSLSWPRILPTGFPDQINEAGVAYYNRLIDEMLKYNIQPAVTIYHWDLPKKLRDLGGWLNPHMVDWFGDYARVTYELFGDRVKYWTTINEPNSFCLAYEHNTMAATSADGHGWYLCAKTLVLAHARAYHIYNDDFKPTQNGIMGIVAFMWWEEPETESEDDLQAVEESNQMSWGIFFNPIYTKGGDFPNIVKEKVAAKSAEQGFPRSRLPELTNEEIEYVRGTADYLGLNHYSTRIVYRNSSVYGINKVPSLEDDTDRGYYQREEWPTSHCSWNKRVPWGFYKVLTKVRDEFNNMPVFIMENGFCTHGGLDDDDRVSYYKEYLGALLDAIEDGCNVIGYTAWSMMDNFEWTSGYTHRFGLYEVDFERSERTRTPRRSAFVYKEILRTRTIDPDYQPDTTVMTIDEGH